MKIEWKTCFRIGFSIFLLYLCIHYLPVATSIISMAIGAAAPILIGCMAAYLLNILMSFYEKHYFSQKDNLAIVSHSRRPVCLIAAILSLLAVIVFIIRLVVPQCISCIQLLLAEIPPAVNALLNNTAITEWLPQNFVEFLATIDWKSSMAKLFNFFSSGISDAMGFTVNVVSTVFSSVVTTFLSIIFAIYLLMGKDTLRKQCLRLMKNYLKPKWNEKLLYVLSVSNDCFRKYIVGQCMEAVILGVLCTLGMMILQLPYATMIGALIAFTALIPVAGAYIGGGVGALMILTASPLEAVVFLIFIVILQQIEGNLIYPKVVGSSVGLPGLWVLAAVTIGGCLFGVLGMLFGVPIFAAVYRILGEDMTRREALLQKRSRRENENKEKQNTTKTDSHKRNVEDKK